MASPASELWWGTFLTAHGNDSEEQKAFLGYLTTQGVDPLGDPAALDAAYTAFHAWMTESYGTPPAARASDAPPLPLVPKSAHADATNVKPMEAATRPLDYRETPPAPPAPPSTMAASAPPATSASSGSGRTRTGK